MDLAVSLYAQKYRDLTTPGREQVLLVRLKELLPEGRSPASTLLDVGCGAGHLTAALAERGYRVLGVDASPEMLEEARRLYPSLNFVGGDVRSYMPTEPVDAVVCLGEVLNHLGSTEAMAQALHHLGAILAPGGTFVAETLDPQDLCAGWEGTTQLFPFDDGWFTVFDYSRLEGNRGRWSSRWLRRQGSGPQAESHSWSLVLQTWTAEEILMALAKAGFQHARAIDLWRGGEVREGTISQFIIAQRD